MLSANSSLFLYTVIKSRVRRTSQLCINYNAPRHQHLWCFIIHVLYVNPQRVAIKYDMVIECVPMHTITIYTNIYYSHLMQLKGRITDLADSKKSVK